MAVRTNPSFTGTVRSELARVDGRSSRERRAELAALVSALGRLGGSRSGPTLQFVTASAALARKLFRYYKKEFSITATIAVRRGSGARGGNWYSLKLPGGKPTLQVLSGLDMLVDHVLVQRVPSFALSSQHTRAAYLRGHFLGAGHVHPPQRGYHLEFILRHQELVEPCAQLMADTGIPVRVARRRDGYALYVRGGEQVAYTLTIMGAHQAVLKFEDARVYRDVRGLVNRLTNAEAANLNKAATAAVKQVQDIQLIAANGGLSSLTESLRVVAEARLEHPELSLRELGQQLSPPLSKSAVAHRMRRIHLLAQKIKAGGSPRQESRVEITGAG